MSPAPSRDSGFFAVLDSLWLGRAFGRGRRARTIAFLAAVFGVAFGWEAAEDAIDARRHPWVRADPPLDGTWVGQFVGSDGQIRGVLLTLARVPASRIRGGRHSRHLVPPSRLQGAAAVCAAGEPERRYRVGGSPEDVDPRDSLDLAFGYPAPESRPPGLEIERLNGRWDGRDGLDFAAAVQWRAPGRAGDYAERPPRLAMRRGTEDHFRAVCARLGRRAEKSKGQELFTG